MEYIYIWNIEMEEMEDIALPEHISINWSQFAMRSSTEDKSPERTTHTHRKE